MSSQEAYDYIKHFLENAKISQEVIDCLDTDVEISLSIDNTIQACFFQKNGKPQLEQRSAINPDLHFVLYPEAYRQLKDKGGDNLAEFSIDFVSQILLGNIEVHLKTGWINILKRGYLKISVSAGGPFLKYLATHGVTNLAKLRHLLSHLKKEG